MHVCLQNRFMLNSSRNSGKFKCYDNKRFESFQWVGTRSFLAIVSGCFWWSEANLDDAMLTKNAYFKLCVYLDSNETSRMNEIRTNFIVWKSQTKHLFNAFYLWKASTAVAFDEDMM